MLRQSFKRFVHFLSDKNVHSQSLESKSPCVVLKKAAELGDKEASETFGGFTVDKSWSLQFEMWLGSRDHLIR